MNVNINRWMSVDTSIQLDTRLDAYKFDVESLNATVSTDHPLIGNRCCELTTLGAALEAEREVILARKLESAASDSARRIYEIIPGLQRRGPASEMLRHPEQPPLCMLEACKEYHQRIDDHYLWVRSKVRNQLAINTREYAWIRALSRYGRDTGDPKGAIATYQRIEQIPAQNITEHDVYEASCAEVTLSKVRAYVRHHVRARGLIRALRGIPYRCIDPTPVGAGLHVTHRLLGG